MSPVRGGERFAMSAPETLPNILSLRGEDGRIVRARSSYVREFIVGAGLFVLSLVAVIYLLNTDYEKVARRLKAFVNPDGLLGAQQIPASWLARYNVSYVDDSDLQSDIDGDGLSLYEEYLYLTNPINPDTDGDGVLDGQEVENRTNPQGDGQLSINKEEILSRFEKLKNEASAWEKLDLIKRFSAFVNPDGLLGAQRIPTQWLARYNVSYVDDSDLQSDIDGDGLSLYDEYLYLTDPTNPDTDGDGVLDGQEVEEENNPRGRGGVDKDGDRMPDKWELTYQLDPYVNDRDLDGDNDGLSNWQEYQYGLDPQNPDTDGDGYSDATELKNGYDPSAPGEVRPRVVISIDKIRVVVPMVWAASVREDDMQRYLKDGAVHYPRTAAPGQEGNMFVAAHSSNYAWVDGNYNEVFKELDKVVPGDIVTFTVSFANGRTVEYLYKVTEQRVTKPDDPWIFMKTDKKALTLSTCWPLGTRQKRLVVKAELVGES